MRILSISLDDESMRLINETQRKLGFRSRSRMLRTAITSMIKDYQTMDMLKGKVECVFVVTYRDAEKNKVTDIFEGYESAIETELHHHHAGMAIDVLNISADASKVRDFFGALKRSKAVKSVMYTTVRQGAQA